MAAVILHECSRPKTIEKIAERCIRLAKTCTEPRVAEQLLIFATNHLEQAELALRSRQPATVVRRQVRLVQQN
jgi:hypothetical protein